MSIVTDSKAREQMLLPKNELENPGRKTAGKNTVILSLAPATSQRGITQDVLNAKGSLTSLPAHLNMRFHDASLG